MIDLHFWPTPNGWKISIMIEECGLPYTLKPVNIGRGAQFEPEFLALSPNNRMPAIVDHDPPGGGAPVSVFESGAILIYLAEKTGRFLPTDLRRRKATLEWLMWQMGGLGPMAGQNGHFLLYAPQKIPYAIERYASEVNRLYGVLDGQLQRTGAFVAGDDYSIADMAIFPWVRIWRAQQVPLDDFVHVKAWYEGPARAPRRAPRHRCRQGTARQRPGRRGAQGAVRPDRADAARRCPQEPLNESHAMIEFFFDCSSPWTYLGFHNIQPLAAEAKVPIRWRPILVGGVFNSVNPSVYASREKPVPAKRDYMLKDLQDWARSSRLKIVMPPTVFPVNSVKAMRGCLWLEPTGPVGALCHRGVRGLLGPRRRHLAGRRAGRDLPAVRHRRRGLLCRHHHRSHQGAAEGQHRRADPPRRLRLADDLRQRQ